MYEVGDLLLFIFNFSSECFQGIQEELELKNIYQPLVLYSFIESRHLS